MHRIMHRAMHLRACYNMNSVSANLDSHGEKGLINSKPCPQNPKIRVPKHIEEKILYLRRTYHFGQQRIAWYVQRYHNIQVSQGDVRGVLLRHGLNRLPRNVKRRAPGPHFKLYEKKVPGHHIQMDVKFLKLENDKGQPLRLFQYTAIDDATRIRVLKIYDKHTQQNAIDFVNTVMLKLPFRIRMVRTDNGHEFQAKFHWHLMDLGISHASIRKGTPRLNGKVERSLRTDDQEFYQLLSFKDDVDLEKKLKTWERFYNFHRPHSAHEGKTPYEVLREKLGV
jgi:transposase InsO family protein